VQHLRENKSATKSALLKLWDDADQSEKAIKSLIADHLIEATGNRFKLAD
jgi:hypothetical protein